MEKKKGFMAEVGWETKNEVGDGRHERVWWALKPSIRNPSPRQHYGANRAAMQGRKYVTVFELPACPSTYSNRGGEKSPLDS